MYVYIYMCEINHLLTYFLTYLLTYLLLLWRCVMYCQINHNKTCFEDPSQLQKKSSPSGLVVMLYDHLVWNCWPVMRGWLFMWMVFQKWFYCTILPVSHQLHGIENVASNITSSQTYFNPDDCMMFVIYNFCVAAVFEQSGDTYDIFPTHRTRSFKHPISQWVFICICT